MAARGHYGQGVTAATVMAATVPGPLGVADPQNLVPRLLANGSGPAALDPTSRLRIQPAPERGSAGMTRSVGSYRLPPAGIGPYQSAHKVMGTRHCPDRDAVHPSRGPQLIVAVRGFRLDRCITQRANPVIDEPASRGRHAGRRGVGARPARSQMTRRPRIRRAMTRRWIWLVPSPISVSFASRMYRSTG